MVRNCRAEPVLGLRARMAERGVYARGALTKRRNGPDERN
jgi:hypothetical protein